MGIEGAVAGRVLGFVPVPVRIGREASAKLCTRQRLIVVIGGLPESPAPPHVDLSLSLWSRNDHRTTVRAIEATAAGQKLVVSMFKPMTLEPGAKPTEDWPQLDPPSGEELRARPG